MKKHNKLIKKFGLSLAVIGLSAGLVSESVFAEDGVNEVAGEEVTDVEETVVDGESVEESGIAEAEKAYREYNYDGHIKVTAKLADGSEGVELLTDTLEFEKTKSVNVEELKAKFFKDPSKVVLEGATGYGHGTISFGAGEGGPSTSPHSWRDDFTPEQLQQNPVISYEEAIGFIGLNLELTYSVKKEPAESNAQKSEVPSAGKEESKNEQTIDNSKYNLSEDVDPMNRGEIIKSDNPAKKVYTSEDFPGYTDEQVFAAQVRFTFGSHFADEWRFFGVEYNKELNPYAKGVSARFPFGVYGNSELGPGPDRVSSYRNNGDGTFTMIPLPPGYRDWRTEQLEDPEWNKDFARDIFSRLTTHQLKAATKEEIQVVLGYMTADKVNEKVETDKSQDADLPKESEKQEGNRQETNKQEVAQSNKQDSELVAKRKDLLARVEASDLTESAKKHLIEEINKLDLSNVAGAETAFYHYQKRHYEEVERQKQTEDKKDDTQKRQGERLPDTATATWILGAIGIASGLTGLGIKKLKKDD